MELEHSGHHGVWTAFSRRCAILAFFLFVVAGQGAPPRRPTDSQKPQ